MGSGKQFALVTGGAGFIGSHLTEHLLANGWRVRVLDDLSTGHAENLAAVLDRIEFMRGCITDEATLRQAVEGVEVVFHLAAKVFVPESFEKPAEYERVNVQGTGLLLAAARKARVRRVVLSSTCAVYGDTTDLPIKETTLPKPLSPYAANKLAAEELGRKAAAAGLAFTALRYFNVYGPRQDPRSAYSGVISRFASALTKGEQVTIYGDGTQTRDFCHVTDIARANLFAAMQADPSFAIYNVGTGRETSIAQLYAQMAGFFVSTSAAHHQPARAGDIARSVADVTQIAEALKFRATTPIESGLRNLLSSVSAPRLRTPT